MRCTRRIATLLLAATLLGSVCTESSLAEPGLQRRERNTLQQRLTRSVDSSSITNSSIDVHSPTSASSTELISNDWRDKINGDNYWPSDLANELRKIHHNDQATQARLRAQLATQMINSRIYTFNRAGIGGLTHYIPGIDLTNHRAAVDLLRGPDAPTSDRGEVFINWAWSLRTGACEEHSAIMAHVLHQVTNLDVKVIKSSAGHSFVAVGLAPGSDPDRPWTWGSNAFIADSWLDEIQTPQQAWSEQWIFADGKAYSMDLTAKENKTMRAWVDYFRNKGPQYVLDHWEQVKARIPAALMNADGTIKSKPGVDIPPQGWVR